jgi:hypothetical protein
MSTGSEPNNYEGAELPSWADYDFFCIHDYAGTGVLSVAGVGGFTTRDTMKPGRSSYVLVAGVRRSFAFPRIAQTGADE